MRGAYTNAVALLSAEPSTAAAAAELPPRMLNPLMPQLPDAAQHAMSAAWAKGPNDVGAIRDDDRVFTEAFAEAVTTFPQAITSRFSAISGTHPATHPATHPTAHPTPHHPPPPLGNPSLQPHARVPVPAPGPGPGATAVRPVQPAAEGAAGAPRCLTAIRASPAERCSSVPDSYRL